MAAEGRNLDAARIALQHAQAGPNGPNAAELLFRSAENAKLGGDAAQAQTTLDQLRHQYPDSPFARQ
jgi:TolA-binding protein